MSDLEMEATTAIKKLLDKSYQQGLGKKKLFKTIFIKFK